MTEVLLSIGLVLLLVIAGGVFAGSEIALVSLREGQLTSLTQRGRRGAKAAELARDPNRFLATIQVGVTLAGFLSAAFGAATIADALTPVLTDLGLSSTLAAAVALVGVTVVIAYFSLVLGELVPKRLALQRPEGIARAMAPSLDRVATLSRPLIWLLSLSTDMVVRLLGGDPQARGEAITEEELRGLVAAHESLTQDERKLIDDVFAAGERQLREVLVPRTEVEFLDAGMALTRAAKVAAASPHSRYPVVRGSHDAVVGFVHVRDLGNLTGARRTGVKVGDLVRPIKELPSTHRVLVALSEMRREGHHLAVVIDEYGGTAGIVSLEDLIEEVIGDIRDEYDVAEPDARRLRGGDVEVDGLLNLDGFAQETGCRLPDGPYETVAGYMMATLGHVPRSGEEVEAGGHRLRVTRLDGRRVDRVRVTAVGPDAEMAPEPGRDAG